VTFSEDFHRESKRTEARGRCLHFSDGVRCNEFISAHSIQKRGQLRLIAEDGHLYRLNADLSTLRATGGLPHPKRIGMNRASTFAGFCKHHDNSLFEPIDNHPLRPTREQVALYAYRSLCREYFVKENAVALMRRMEEHPGANERTRRLMKSSLTGNLRGFDGLRHHKSIYDEALRSGNFEDFDFTCFISRSRCSLQLSGLLYPDFDFLGRQLQHLGDWSSPLDLITFFTAPCAQGWAFAFAWHRSSSQTCLPFMESLAHRVGTGEKLQDALLRFAFSACENHAFRISWWNDLPLAAKKAVIERMILMVDPNVPVPSNYLVAGCEGIADWEFEYVDTTLHAAA
jgi:hypothetical protein